MFRIVCARVPPRVVHTKIGNIPPSTGLSKALRYYSQNVCPPTKKKKPKGRYMLVGTITLLAGSTLAYAKYDAEFRKSLVDQLPFTDDVMKFIFQEEKGYVESLVGALDSIKGFVVGLFGSSEGGKKIKNIPVQPKDYTPPSPAFQSLAKEKGKEEAYAEIRLEKKEEGQDEPIVTITGEQKPTEVLTETHPKSIAEMEKKMAETASATVQAYNKAVYALRNYNADVQIIVEDSVDKVNPVVWNSLRDKTKKKDETVKEAEAKAKETKEYISKLRVIVRDPSTEAPDTLKQTLLLNMSNVEDDIAKAQKEFKNEQNKSSVTERYWKKVEEARSHFIDELEILFPGVNINEKKLELDGPELDLFIMHAFSNVLYYQKNMYKLQTIEEESIKSALDAARKGNKEVLSDKQINQLVEKERRKLEAEYAKRCLCLRVESEKELRRQLKLQSQTFADHLSDALLAKEMEMQRDLVRKIDEKVTEERCKFKLQLSALAGRVKGMDEALKARMESEKMARQAQVLWSACQALYRALKAGCPGLPWQQQIRPLDAEIRAIQKAASSEDELVKLVLNGIPVEAKERGVFPEDALKERFLKVEKVCRHVALIPEGGARLPYHLLSFLHSFMLLQAINPIPQSELDDKETDFSNFSTDDILQRARYWIDRGDFAQSLRYMNLLDGAARCAAYQWMNETRVLLETQQAANVLMAHAAANGLVYL